MSDAPIAPVTLWVQLNGGDERRRFLVDHLRRLVPSVCDTMTFADLGNNALELAVEAPQPDRFAAWMREVVESATVGSIRRVRNAAERSDAWCPNTELTDRYRHANRLLSRQALDLLAAYSPALPDQVARAELRRVHVNGGTPLQSCRWHMQWLAAVSENGPWPDEGDEASMLTSRLAHVHWLRLTDGDPGYQAEVDALRMSMS